MNRPLIAAAALALAAVTATLAIALRPEPAPARAQLEIVERVPFTLEQSAVHDYRAERPSFTSGEIVVVRSHGPDLEQRAVATPVLYCGAETAQQLNRATSGVVVCVVPHADDRERSAELGVGPWYQGAPNLPEQVTLPLAEAELEAALRRGVVLQTTEAAAPVALVDEAALHLLAADLIEKHVPDESDTVRGIRGY